MFECEFGWNEEQKKKLKGKCNRVGNINYDVDVSGLVLEDAKLHFYFQFNFILLPGRSPSRKGNNSEYCKKLLVPLGLCDVYRKMKYEAVKHGSHCPRLQKNRCLASVSIFFFVYVRDPSKIVIYVTRIFHFRVTYRVFYAWYGNRNRK